MKTIYAVLLAGLVLSLFANCAKNNGQSSGTTDMNAACYNRQVGSNNPYASTPNTTCNTAAYSASGFSSVVSSGQSYSGYAGYYSQPSVQCAGALAYPQLVYSSSKGLGCVDASYINVNGQVVPYTLSPQTGTFIQTTTNGSIYGGSVLVYRACDTSDLCPSGQTCRSPFGPSTSSAVGICYF